ncbi:MAG: acetate kinase, partial [Chloroflexi bacterium]|nr:acetate kinase [Chloroflexota bacterium]
MNVLVINAGSSSLKYQLVNVEKQELLAKGICERVGSAEALHKHGLDKNEVVIDVKMGDHDDAMALVIESLISGSTKAIDSLDQIDAVGHRIVQGGKYFDRSVLIDNDVIDKIDELAELAPLHNKAA